MLRNFIIDNNTKINTLIVNKYLVTKPVDTSNLTINNTEFKNISNESNYVISSKFYIFKIVVHINNNFNPTNINLFDSGNSILFYKLDGDEILHVNLGLLTFFRILSNNLPNIKIKNSNLDFKVPNSNLSGVLIELIKTSPISYYIKDERDNWVLDCEFYLKDFENFKDPQSFNYDSESDFNWRYDFVDILIFYHNIWWSAILILFNLYNIKVWGGKNDPDSNTNKFRLKVEVLKLLGGFSKLNLLENMLKSTNNHYVINDNKFKIIKEFNVELSSIDETINQQDKELSLTTSVENLLISLKNNLDSVNNLLEDINKIVINQSNDTLESEFEFELEVNMNRGKNKLNLSESDEVSFKPSLKEFEKNIKFNLYFIYVLSLEMLIKITFKKLNYNLKLVNKNKVILSIFEKLLFTTIKNYLTSIFVYNNDYLGIKSNQINLSIPSDFPLPSNLDQNYCLCEKLNKIDNSLTLIFSGVKIKFDIIPEKALNCKETCLSLKGQTDNVSSSATSTTTHKINTISKREYSTYTKRINKPITNKKDSNLDTQNLNYNKGIFMVLEKIKKLTSPTNKKSYSPKEAQLEIENFWSDVIKEKYIENNYKPIQDFQPKIYDVFLFSNIKILERVFPDLYLFLDDIRIFLMTYSVITTYFRRTSRTNISVFVANQILFFIYKNYFDPIISTNSKGVNQSSKRLKSSLLNLEKKEFSRTNLLKSLSKTKRERLEKSIDLPLMSKEGLNENNINKKRYEKDTKLKKTLILTKIWDIYNRIIEQKKLENIKIKEYLNKNKKPIDSAFLKENLRLDLSIDFNDFIKEVCINQEANNKNKDSLYFIDRIVNMEDSLLLSYQDKFEFNKRLEFDLIITSFKVKLGERFISYFEDYGLINETWRNGSRHIILQDMDAETSQSLKTLDFNENLIQENIDKLSNILPTNLPMICEPNKWSDTEFGGYLNNSLEKNNLISGLGFTNAHKVKSLKNLYSAINYLNSIKFKVNTEVLDYILTFKNILFKNYYNTSDNEKLNDKILRDLVTLEIAKTFYSVPFYLNTFADWRGRIYTNSYYLSYQGSDLSLALIEFDEGQIITEKGVYFFKNLRSQRTQRG